MELKDKVAVVTGSSGGMGRAIASALAREGARLVLADISAEKSEELLNQFEGIAVKADLSMKTDIDNIVEALIQNTSQV